MAVAPAGGAETRTADTRPAAATDPSTRVADVDDIVTPCVVDSPNLKDHGRRVESDGAEKARCSPPPEPMSSIRKCYVFVERGSGVKVGTYRLNQF